MIDKGPEQVILYYVAKYLTKAATNSHGKQNVKAPYPKGKLNFSFLTLLFSETIAFLAFFQFENIIVES